MPPGSVRDEIQRLRLCRIEHRIDRRTPRIGDRPDRQPARRIGIIAVPRLQFRPADTPAKRFALRDRIDDRRIGLQSHSRPQAVGIDGGHHASLRRLAGFLFDDRREDDRLARGLDHRRRLPLLPRCGQIAVHRHLHPPDQCSPVAVAFVTVAVGQDTAFRRKRCGALHLGRPGHRLAHQHRWPPLRHHDEALQRTPALQQLQDIRLRDARRYPILPGAESVHRCQEGAHTAESGRRSGSLRPSPVLPPPPTGWPPVAPSPSRSAAPDRPRPSPASPRTARRWRAVRRSGRGSRSGARDQIAFITSEALVPPKPKLLFNTARTGRFFAWCGTRSTPSVPSSGLSRFSVGGTI